MKKFLVILISVISFLIISCDSKKPAKGFEDEIFVVADSVEYVEMLSSLQSVFEKEIYTPQPVK